MFFIKYGLETKGTLAPRVLDILFCFWGFFLFFPPLFFAARVRTAYTSMHNNAVRLNCCVFKAVH